MMNARHILDTFKQLCFKPDNKQLGRWHNHTYNQTVLKIKYANEDNCGISGNNYIQIQPNNLLDDCEYIYIMGYETAHK